MKWETENTKELILLSQAGDKAAREQLINENAPLVKSIVKRYLGRGVEYDDLYQIGNMGLLKAISGFNTQFDVRFSTYAVPMIIGELRRYLRDNTAMRVSRSLRDTAYKALQMRNKLMEENAREPHISEVAKALGMKEEDVVFALDAIQDPVSLFEPIYHDDGDAIYVMDQVRDERSSDDLWLDGIAIEGGLGKLGARERRIIELRFFHGRTQMEVASEIGISQAQVSRLEKSALKHMRKYV